MFYVLNAGVLISHAAVPAFSRRLQYAYGLWHFLMQQLNCIIRMINQSINLLKAKGQNGHLHRSKIHDMQ